MEDTTLALTNPRYARTGQMVFKIVLPIKFIMLFTWIKM